MLSFFQIDAVYVAFVSLSIMNGFLKGFNRFSKANAFFYSIFSTILLTPHVVLIVNGFLMQSYASKYVSVFILYPISVVFFMLFVSDSNKDEKKQTKRVLNKFIGSLLGGIRGLFISFCFCVLFLTFEVNITEMKLSSLSSMLFRIAELWMPKEEKRTLLEKTTKNLHRISFSALPVIETKEEPEIRKEKVIKQRDERHNLSVIKYVADLFSRTISGVSEIEKQLSSEPSPVINPLPIKNTNFIRAKYGCMLLLEARIKRQAQRKKELIEKAIITQFDWKKQRK